MKPYTFEAVLAGSPRPVQAARGVFSGGELDRGTEVLLTRAPEPVQFGNVLDIGCGWGPISLDTALRAPGTTVWAVDVNERALELTRANAASLGLSNVKVCTPDAVPAEVQFTEIRSNPPIRVGKEVLHELMRTWLPRLLPGGEAYFVVAKHLGADSLQKWIDAEFDGFTVWREARNKGFHVIAVSRDED